MRKVKISKYGQLLTEDSNSIACPLVMEKEVVSVGGGDTHTTYNCKVCHKNCAWFHSYKDWYIYPIDEKYAQREENRCYCGDKLIGELIK